ncbi:MAG: hypothetical protein ACYTF1_15305 [Planctomycetota bacterium]|jgi:hypothetical protein
MSANIMIDLITQITASLEEEGITYAVTGSVASSIHGEPVTSIDIDIVTNMKLKQATRLADKLAPRMYADANMLRQAVVEHGMVNLYDTVTGFKIDISVLEDTKYHKVLMKRRIRIAHPRENVSFWVVSPEDVILMKLVWRQNSQSQKQWDNALGVARVQGNQLDWKYLHSWAARLGITDDLNRLAGEAGI